MRKKIGIYNLFAAAGGGGERQAAVLAEALSAHHDVILIVRRPLEVSAYGAYFGCDLSPVRVAVLPPPRLVYRLLRAPAFPLPQHVRARVPELGLARQVRALGLDLLINTTYRTTLTNPARRGIHICMFPGRETDPRMLASYDEMISISRFTQQWVERRWHRGSTLVHPPCDSMGPPGEKERSILHVGRFDASAGREIHHKRQDVLLAAFAAMPELHREGWQLHFAGSVANQKSAVDSFEKLVRSAAGLPVTFHRNIDLSGLASLYRRAAVYWHATGFGTSEEDEPAAQEHFGISTVEAMSAGAVPVVFGSGGQKEIVTQGENGYLWREIAELQELTRRLAADEALRSRLAARAVESSERFSRSSYAQRMSTIVETLLQS